MAEAGAEVLPEGSGGAWIVGGEEKSKHEDQAAGAGGADGNAEKERESDGEFAVRDEKGDGRGVGEDEVKQNGRHERIRGAVGEEFVDPELKAAVKSEFGAEDFVLGEDEEERAHADAQSSESAGVGIVCGDGRAHG